MTLSAQDFLEAARVPRSVQPQVFGEWEIVRCAEDDLLRKSGLFIVGWPDYTLLYHTLPMDESNMHISRPQDVVMEDSQRELSRHLPIWLKACGRVLITGLGLGCVVRGLLANPDVDHVDVVEQDADILRVIGAEFADPRVTLHHGDAQTIDLEGRWDYAWHDLWTSAGGYELTLQHAKLLHRFRDRCGPQGAWAFPRFMKRAWQTELLG